MKKNISSLLQKGNLTPKERFILLIQNDLEKAKTDKGFLTEADIQGLQNWQAKTPAEAKEWNRYNEGWKLSGRAGMEAEFVYAETKAEHFRKNIIATELSIYPFYRDHLDALKALKKIKIVDIKEAIEITNKQREVKLKQGCDFEYSVFELAMELLGDKDRARLEEATDEDAIFDEQRLDHETKIAELLAGETELTKEAKEKLAELVGKHSTNNYTKESQLYFDYASIPLYEIAERFLKDKGVKFSESKDKVIGRAGRVAMDMMGRDILDKAEKLKEILENYARDNKITIEAIIKETCLKLLDEDLLKKYPPLVLREKELFNKWLKTKTEARATLQKLIDKGELKAEETGQDKTITGESLYNFKGDFKFAKKFIERVDKYEADLGLVYADGDTKHEGENIDRELLIADKDKDGKPSTIGLFGRAIDTIEMHFDTTRFFKETEKDGETYLDFKSEDIEKAFKDTRQGIIDGYKKLLAFQDVFKRLSKTYKADLAFLINEKVEQVSEFIDTHNAFLGNALEDLYGLGVGFGLYKKPLKTRDNLFIEKNKLQADTKTLNEWTTKFEEILGDDF
jgi:hypothetical protein